MRLTSLTSDLADSTYDVTTTLAYNPAGQITSATRSNDAYAWTGAATSAKSYTANGLNQFTAAGGTSLGYDAKGNLNVSGSNTYTYSQRNQLMAYAIGSTSGTLFYDPPGRLTLLTGNATTFDHDGDRLSAERAWGGTTVERCYVFGAGTDEPLVWYEGSGTSDRRFLVSDERGSIVAVTNGSGTATAINTYDEYGVPGSGNTGRFQYTGQAWLPALGMYYYKARMYSPTLGRFMQTDPIGYGDGLNWYNYVGGDPVNGRDASGTDTATPNPPSCIQNNTNCGSIEPKWGKDCIGNCGPGYWNGPSEGLGTPTQQLKWAGWTAADGGGWIPPSGGSWVGCQTCSVTSDNGKDIVITGNTIKFVSDYYFSSFPSLYISNVNYRFTEDKESFNPSEHYCGSHGFNVPDGNWKEACAVHDQCYGTAGASKTGCDYRLWMNMAALCNMRTGGTQGTGCATIGGIYFLGLSIGGGPVYSDAQKGR